MNEQRYKQNTGQVIAFLNDNHYNPMSIRLVQQCFNELEDHLKNTGQDYSPGSAEQWLNHHKLTLPSYKLYTYRPALKRLAEVYSDGSVLITSKRGVYHLLSGTFRNELDSFLSNAAEESKPNLRNLRSKCSQFLFFIQSHGAESSCDITSSLVLLFCKHSASSSRQVKYSISNIIGRYLKYLYDKGLVTYGVSVTMRCFFNARLTGHGLQDYWNNVSDDGHDRIRGILRTKPSTSLSELHRFQKQIDSLLVEKNYSLTNRQIFHRAIDILLLFLENNSYQYNPEVAKVWHEEISQTLKTLSASVYRALCLIEQCYINNEIHLERAYRPTPDLFDRLPEWCKKAAAEYVTCKVKEGWSASTISMIRTCIARFCGYLDHTGIHSYREIDITAIHEFNVHDTHETPEAKNAYNSRIRAFLMFLGERGYLEHPLLSQALDKVYTSGERNIIVLTAEETEKLQKELRDENGCLTLRNKAILLLGIRMGLRESDIVRLTIQDIRWKEQCMHLIQKKTKVEITLPMPADVANALYRYISEERPHVSVPEIFLSERTPHRPIRGNVCLRALHAALPDRHVWRSGFHVTRKTFATTLLNDGVGVGMVADALGQRGTENVMKYLSLDEERMHLCALTLDDCGIGGWK